MTAPRSSPSGSGPTLRQRLAASGIDSVTLLLLPAAAIILILFIYPFAYGTILSLHPEKGSTFANYVAFFSDPYLYDTIFATLKIALPVTVFSLLVAIPIALRVRLLRRQRVLTTLLVVPVTLGTVLVAQGLLDYLGPQGWLNRSLIWLGLLDHPIRLLHNYWGVVISLVITGFPFTFLLMLSYVTGIDPALERAAAMLGAGARQRFVHVILPLLAPGIAIDFCLSFVQSFSVFPSAVMLGSPAGGTRVISIAAYHAAFEQYDYSMGSTIAIIMALVELLIVAVALASSRLFYNGPSSGGKG